MVSAMSGWLATRTSCPAARSAHATGTCAYRCAFTGSVTNSTRMVFFPSSAVTSVRAAARDRLDPRRAGGGAPSLS